MYFQKPMPVHSLKQLLARFLQCYEAQDPSASCLIFVTIAAFGTEGRC